MLTFFLSLLTTFMIPAGVSAAPPAAPAAGTAATADFAWIGGTWTTSALEMKCRVTAEGAACHEEGSGEAMRGAVADLVFRSARADGPAQLTVVLPSIPPSVFTETARAGDSVTFEMPTRAGVARLRFTRSSDTLKIERGNAEKWGTQMTYRKTG